MRPLTNILKYKNREIKTQNERLKERGESLQNGINTLENKDRKKNIVIKVEEEKKYS